MPSPHPLPHTCTSARRARWLWVLTALLAVASLAAACGDDDDAVATDTAGSAPNETPAGGDEAPQRIVSLSPTATEILFAIGAGPRVVAVDDQSTHPPEAPRTDLSGFTLSIESLLATDPDLVVAMYDPGDLVAAMGSAGIPLVLQGAASNLEEAYAQILELGEATGRSDAAEALVADLRVELELLAMRLPERETPLTYFHEIDDTLYTATSATFIGEVYAMAGLVNIADAADPDGTFGGYPQVSAELVLEQDPDIIFLADGAYGVTPETVAARPGWSTLRAVETGRIVTLDGDLVSRWGPRVVDLFASIVEAVEQLEAEAVGSS